MESVIALRHQLSTVDFPAHVAVVPKPTGGASVGHQRFLWRMLTLLVVAIIAVVGAIAQTPGHTRGVTAVSAAQTQLSTTARLAVSRALGGDLDEYQLTRFSGGFRARNSRQGLTANFGVHGATIATHDGARVSIGLQAIGLGMCCTQSLQPGQWRELTALNTGAAGQPNGLPMAPQERSDTSGTGFRLPAVFTSRKRTGNSARSACRHGRTNSSARYPPPAGGILRARLFRLVPRVQEKARVSYRTTQINDTWTGTVWFIEGDISDCFGSLRHEILLAILAEKIHTSDSSGSSGTC